MPPQRSSASSGFDVGDFGSQSRTGRYGDYTASIRCVATSSIVFFVLIERP